MSSLTGRTGIEFPHRTARAGVSEGDAGGSRFMPRFASALLRRAARFVNSATPMRNGVGNLLAVSFVVAGALYGAFVGGHGPVVLSGAAKAVGLKATDIIITGQLQTTEQELYNALALGETRSLVGFDAGEARERVLALPWVEHVEVRKFYPGRLLVELREKKPFAVWQKSESLFVVESDGDLITKFGIADLLDNRFSYLPHLVGDGAAEHATDILPIAARFPKIAKRVQAYVRVANRRWDVKLPDGLTVKLPEYGIGHALTQLAKLDVEQQLLSRQVSVVDMRLPDRVTVRLEPDAASERAKLVATRLKAMKKAERNL